jgi:hypothetical protein
MNKVSFDELRPGDIISYLSSTYKITEETTTSGRSTSLREGRYMERLDGTDNYALLWDTTVVDIFLISREIPVNSLMMELFL